MIQLLGNVPIHCVWLTAQTAQAEEAQLINSIGESYWLQIWASESLTWLGVWGNTLSGNITKFGKFSLKVVSSFIFVHIKSLFLRRIMRIQREKNRILKLNKFFWEKKSSPNSFNKFTEEKGIRNTLMLYCSLFF